MHFRSVAKVVCSACAGAGLLLALWPAWRLCLAQSAEPGLTPHVEPWLQADQLFRSDPRWLGGDVAYSIDLGRERVLWLFGDSFIADLAGAQRGQATMVRNSVAIQTGYDPSRSSLKFYWKKERGQPASFVPGTGDVWLWPAHGVRLGGKLLLFFTRVRPDSRKDSLGFENFGWAAFLVDNPDEEPSAWVLQRAAVPSNTRNVIAGAAALVVSQFLYVFSPAEPSHDIYLLRWPLCAAAKGDLASPKWWCGLKHGWAKHPEAAHPPVPAIRQGAMEFSVQWVPQRRKFLMVQSVGMGASDIAVRWADRLEGPWPAPGAVYRPEESARPDALVYAAKAHAELAGADLVITYVANSRDFGILTRDPSIYYPRFVRLWFSPHDVYEK